MSTGVRRGLAQTPSQIARAHGISAESSVRTAVATTLASYHAEMHLRMRDAPRLSIAFDGKRLGQPAKETVAIAASQGDHQEGMWLPQQAFGDHFLRFRLGSDDAWRVAACLITTSVGIFYRRFPGLANWGGEGTFRHRMPKSLLVDAQCAEGWGFDRPPRHVMGDVSGR